MTPAQRPRPRSALPVRKTTPRLLLIPRPRGEYDVVVPRGRGNAAGRPWFSLFFTPPQQSRSRRSCTCEMRQMRTASPRITTIREAGGCTQGVSILWPPSRLTSLIRLFPDGPWWSRLKAPMMGIYTCRRGMPRRPRVFLSLPPARWTVQGA